MQSPSTMLTLDRKRVQGQSRVGEHSVVLDWPIGPGKFHLSTAEVHVWSACLNASSHEVQYYWQILSADERQRAGRFHFGSDWMHFVVARGVLRILVGEYLSLAASALCFEYGVFGKPELAGSHESDIHFNVSHSADVAVYGFVRSMRLGLDVESEESIIKKSGVPESSFSASEQCSLDTLSTADRPLASLTLWTRKEAYLKALGCGLQQEVSRIEFSVPPAVPKLIRGAEEDAAKNHWTFRDLQPACGFVGTLCAESNVEAKLWSWRPQMAK